MLLANETVAEDILAGDSIFIRSHEAPDEEKMYAGTFINNFGYSITWEYMKYTPKEIQKFCESGRNSEEALISRLALRSMKQARYTTGECTDISDWQRILLLILLHRSVDIRICRSTGSSKRIRGRMNAEKMESLSTDSCGSGRADQ